MTDRRALVGSLVPLLLLSAAGRTSRCSVATDSGTGTVELRIRGTVRYVETGRGCWRLDAGEGRHYELLPEQAPAALLRDGATTTVTGETVARETACQVGLPLRVRRVISIESAPVPADGPFR